MDPRRRVVSTGRGSRSRASACRCAPVALPSSLSAVAASSSANSPTVWMPSRCSFSAVTAPTPHSRSTGSGSRNASSRSGSTTSSPSGLLTALATLARNLVRATPTEMASPTSARTRSRNRTAICSGVPAMRRRPPTSRNASSMESPSTSGVVSRKIANTCSTGRGVGVHPRRDDHGIRAQLARLPAAHRGAHPTGLRLVARRQHHAAADDDGPAAQRGRVTLLDRGVEGVEIGVQHGRLAPHPALPPIVRPADRRTHRRHGVAVRWSSERAHPRCGIAAHTQCRQPIPKPTEAVDGDRNCVQCSADVAVRRRQEMAVVDDVRYLGIPVGAFVRGVRAWATEVPRRSARLRCVLAR